MSLSAERRQIPSHLVIRLDSAERHPEGIAPGLATVKKWISYEYGRLVKVVNHNAIKNFVLRLPDSCSEDR